MTKIKTSLSRQTTLQSRFGAVMTLFLRHMSTEDQTEHPIQTIQ